jgi:hypothetical protein
MVVTADGVSAGGVNAETWRVLSHQR